MIKLLKNNSGGFSVVEVLVSLSMAAIIVLSIGQAVAAVHRVNNAGEQKEKALALAKQSLEIMTEIKNDSFACVCDSDSCAGGDLCTKVSDAQSCSLFGGFNSCWTEYPDNLAVNYPLQLEQNGGTFRLIYGIETVTSQPGFTREIVIENLQRDNNGDIVETGGTQDINTKKITVTVKWNEQNIEKEVKVSTILTAWESL